ncbi:flagellar biosynthesis protein FlgA [Mycolicibacter terrae]|uniref:Flagellar biosynthesis protein FlgA n=2 Tax=Mycolicibacter TaxID=1073531 RepID=A0A1A2XUG6_MYCSD|nr:MULTISPECIES: SAF domain-containing protein [Mycolicibacter]OBH21214.1 flagellar biosynthesis protein FlgA [Mycolicibacter sinensis]OBI28546.1 flagellar biosynthesis protein FlgA [Mycolicibacter sinensis]RRR40905.1 flagellar biosynthesis protein FlgA [Mycolicibacter terrae]
MGESLNPTLISRVSQALRPDWARTVRARRAAAGALVVLAGVAAIRSDPQGDRVDVVVASRDLAPGTALTAADVALENHSARTVPDGAATDLSSVLAATLAGPARRGEVLTDVRLLGSRLTDAVAGPDARIVGVHPADAALVDLVRPGDVVDVVTADDGADPPGAPKVVASGGIVVLVSDKQNHDDRVVLVALPATAAVAVAGAALGQAVTLTLR